MTYYADKVTDVSIDDSRRFPVIRGRVLDGHDTVQLYQAGALVDHQAPVSGEVTFGGALPGPIDPFFLLAVDSADALTNYWDEAFPEVAAAGNRISVQYQTVEGIQIGWRWRVSIDSVIMHEADIFPTSDGAGGYGIEYGTSYGHGPFGGGYGSSYGTSYGHGGGIALEWISDPLFIGSYQVDVSIIDNAENVSTPASEVVTIETYPRPARDLLITGYTPDTLSLSWIESEDL